MKITGVSIKNITPEMAQQMLNDFPYERQRPVNNHYVAHYAHMMKIGEWIDGTEIVVAYAPDGHGGKVGHLVNGQHRLLAVIKAGLAVSFTFKTYECKNSAEVAQVYGMIDTGKSRSMRDYLRALSLEDEFGLSPMDNGKLSSAATLILAEFSPSKKSDFTPGEKLEAMRTYAVAASCYIDIITKGAKFIQQKMRVSAPMAVGIITLDEATRRYGDERVMDFWKGIAENDGLRSGDPRKVAYEHLVQATYRNAGSRGTNGSAFYSARYLANCFNAWINDRQIRYTKVTDVYAPINILGTRFRG